MVNGITKRIVVIKDIPSNIIEEAILVLKSEPSGNAVKAGLLKSNKKNNDYLLKEAELVINNYIRENKLGSIFSERVGVATRTSKVRNKLTTNTVINIALIGSFALLIYVVARLIG